MIESFPNKYNEEEEHAIDTATDGIDAMPELLGFTETYVMTDLRTGYIAARHSGDIDRAGELITHYHILGQQVVEQQPPESYPQTQIGLMVSLAIVRRDAGVFDLFVADILDAADYAGNVGLQEIKDSLENTVSSAVADTLRVYGEAHGFDQQTCDEIANQQLSDAIETAYSYLAQAGLDPESVLVPFLQDKAT